MLGFVSNYVLERIGHIESGVPLASRLSGADQASNGPRLESSGGKSRNTKAENGILYTLYPAYHRSKQTKLNTIFDKQTASSSPSTPSSLPSSNQNNSLHRHPSPPHQISPHSRSPPPTPPSSSSPLPALPPTHTIPSQPALTTPEKKPPGSYSPTTGRIRNQNNQNQKRGTTPLSLLPNPSHLRPQSVSVSPTLHPQM